MERLDLEDVFNEAGYPRYTFVKPKEYPYLRSSLNQKGSMSLSQDHRGREKLR